MTVPYGHAKCRHPLCALGQGTGIQSRGAGIQRLFTAVYRQIKAEDALAVGRSRHCTFCRAQRIFAELEEYRLRARLMRMGLEHALKIAIHPFASPATVARVLSGLEANFPSVQPLCVRGSQGRKRP